MSDYHVTLRRTPDGPVEHRRTFSDVRPNKARFRAETFARDMRKDGWTVEVMDAWRDGEIYADWADKTYVGQYRTDMRWNGWVIPRFPKASAEEIVADQVPLVVDAKYPDDIATLIWDGDTVVMTEWEAEPIRYEPDGDGFYHIGSMAWTWSLPMVDIADIAKRLGVPKDTVHKWRSRGVLPAPAFDLKMGPVWYWETIINWADETGRSRR